MIPKIVSKEKRGSLYRVVFTDGKETWFGDVTENGLRVLEIHQMLDEAGIPEKIISEYYDLGYQEGREGALGD